MRTSNYSQFAENFLNGNDQLIGERLYKRLYKSLIIFNGGNKPTLENKKDFLKWLGENPEHWAEKLENQKIEIKLIKKYNNPNDGNLYSIMLKNEHYDAHKGEVKKIIYDTVTLKDFNQVGLKGVGFSDRYSPQLKKIIWG